ncbi:MAG TPA: NTP transferase domain-containing protein [Acidimicrobiales bacterium]|nr:NTP transferase domain-containing protein [Acidimicrobiales bacterium]
MGQRNPALDYMNDPGGADLTLVVLAAGRAKRYGGCKPLAPVGPHGEAVIDLVASDGLGAGFSSVVLVLGPSTGPAVRYHVERTWPDAVDVRFALQPEPRGTVDAVLSAAEYIGDSPYGVCNADDVYGIAGCTLLAQHLRANGEDNALVGYRLADAIVGFSPVTRGICRVDPNGRLLGVDERRQVSALPEGGFVAADGREPATLPGDARVSMNLWGFTPDFHKVLQSALDAAVDASEEKEVLLPVVVAESLGTSSFAVLPAEGRCVGVTHPDDLALVQAELNRQVASGERPARLWPSLG